jgi:hypothetical protein
MFQAPNLGVAFRMVCFRSDVGVETDREFAVGSHLERDMCVIELRAPGESVTAMTRS